MQSRVLIDNVNDALPFLPMVKASGNGMQKFVNDSFNQRGVRISIVQQVLIYFNFEASGASFDAPSNAVKAMRLYANA